MYYRLVKNAVVDGESLEAMLEEDDRLMKTKKKTISTLYSYL